MNGAEHYAEAERLLRAGAQLSDIHPSRPVVTATAQVHATLALAAATALTSTHHYVGDSREITEWARIAQPDAMATKPRPDGCRDIRGDGCLPRCVDTRAAQPAPIDEEPPF